MKRPYTPDLVDTLPESEAIEKYGRLTTQEGDKLRLTLFTSKEGTQSLRFENISHYVTPETNQTSYHPVTRYRVDNFNSINGVLCLGNPYEALTITAEQVEACKRFIRRMQEVKWS